MAHVLFITHSSTIFSGKVGVRGKVGVTGEKSVSGKSRREKSVSGKSRCQADFSGKGETRCQAKLGVRSCGTSWGGFQSVITPSPVRPSPWS